MGGKVPNMDALTNCSCPGDGRTITGDDVSVVLSCASCGGWAVVITDFIDGCIDALTKIKADCYRAIGEVQPLGKPSWRRARTTTAAAAGTATAPARRRGRHARSTFRPDRHKYARKITTASPLRLLGPTRRRSASSHRVAVQA